MPKNPTVAANNVFCIARKEAASFNDSLNSREGASELLGIDRTRIARKGAGTARKNYYSRESFAQVPTRKSLLLRRKRRSFAFGKTTALLFTIAAITIAGQALNEQASGIDIQHQEPTPSATPATVTNQTAYIERETAARSMTSSRPVPTAEATPTQEPTPEPNPTVRIYDIPLSEDLQAFTFNLCEEYGVDYEMVLAIMDKESDYTASAISKSSDYGIMQINKINHKWLTEELEVTDFLDPEQNIRCGIYMLADLMKKYDDPHRVLMAYNMGERGAREYVAKGNTSSAYSRYIMQLRDKLLQEGGKE